MNQDYSVNVVRTRETNGDVYYFYSVSLNGVEVYQHDTAYLSITDARHSGWRRVERMQAVTA